MIKPDKSALKFCDSAEICVEQAFDRLACYRTAEEDQSRHALFPCHIGEISFHMSICDTGTELAGSNLSRIPGNVSFETSFG